MTTNPTKPQAALTIYLDSRRNDVTEETLQSTEYRLNHFVRWCRMNDIDLMGELEKQDMADYRVWRREDGDLARASEKTQMDSLRVFIRYCERMDMVEKDLSQAVVSPTLSDEDKQKNDIVEFDKARAVLERLDRFHYASRNHALFLLAWRTAMRTSGLRAIDLVDYNSDEQYVEVVNRPEKGTRLKNGRRGERFVALSEETCAILDDYIYEHRIDSVDEYNREPFFTTRQGRVAKNTVRGAMYRLTRPCWYSHECPHDEIIEECRPAQESDYVFECPSSTAPHSVRRGSITHMLRNDVPEKAVSDRANVSEEVLERHYDKRTERERMEMRRGYLDNV